MKLSLIVLFLNFCLPVQVQTPAVAKHASDKNAALYEHATALIYNLSNLQSGVGNEMELAAVKEGDNIREASPFPGLLICRNFENLDVRDTCEIHWGSDTLHSHYIMEQLRADIIWLRTSRWGGGFMDDTKSIWAQARDIFCSEQPRAIYNDLDGVSRNCPAK